MGLVNDMGSIGRWRFIRGIVAAAAFNAGLLLRLWCGKDAEGIRAAVKVSGEDTRQRVEEKYGRLFANKPAYADVHADVIALNRSLNPL